MRFSLRHAARSLYETRRGDAEGRAGCRFDLCRLEAGERRGHLRRGACAARRRADCGADAPPRRADAAICRTSSDCAAEARRQREDGGRAETARGLHRRRRAHLAGQALVCHDHDGKRADDLEGVPRRRLRGTGLRRDRRGRDADRI